MSEMNDEEIKVVFEAAKIQIDINPLMVQAIAKTLATEKAKVAPATRFVAS